MSGRHCAYCDYSTPVNDTTPLARHVNDKHPSTVFLCRRRTGLSTHEKAGLPDCWEMMPNGDRTCIYCGSLSEEDLFEIIEHFLAGDEGYEFSTTDKGVKVYARRPGVQNASQGGIKFYGHHADKSHPDFDKRAAMFDRAVTRFNEHLHALLERNRNKKPE